MGILGRLSAWLSAAPCGVAFSLLFISTVFLTSGCEQGKSPALTAAASANAPAPAATTQSNDNAQGPATIDLGGASDQPADQKPLLSGGAGAISPVVIKGSGAFSNPAANEDVYDFGNENTQDTDITLNFVDVDIRELIKSILGDILSISYTIDPAVSGTVTLKTNTPLSRSELIPALESVLQLNGAALVQRAGGISIMPAADVKSPPILAARQTNGFGLEVVRLSHIGATEIKNVLDQYSKEGVTRIADEARGLIVIAGSGPERMKIRQLIDVFDVDMLTGMSFGIFPVDAAEPEEVIAELDAMFHGNAQQSDPSLRFVPIKRMSAILVIATKPGDIDSVGAWIERLDRRIVSDEPRLYVHYVQHGEAKKIASTLQAIFGGQQSTIPLVNDAAGSVAPNQEPALLTTPAASATPAGSYGAPPASNFSNFGDSDNENEGPPPSPSPVASTPDMAAPSGDKKLKIIADEPNNALFILATPQDFRLVEAALQHLDTEPLQVLIEATIAEVTLNDKLKYGVEWFFEHGNSSISLSQVASGIPTAVFPGFNYVYAGSKADVVLSALDAVTDINVISSPQLMVLDNRTAKLQVGDQVPIITQSAVSVSDPGAPIVNSVQFRDTGVILKVTPRVNGNGGVELDIEQEVSDVVPTTTSTIDSPTIQQRRIKSSVSVHDGESIALGGLIRDRQSKEKSGLPLLSDIPVLGALFGTTTNRSDRTELLVLITPRVVHGPADANEITEELRRRLQSLTPLGGKIQAQ